MVNLKREDSAQSRRRIIVDDEGWRMPDEDVVELW
jgi:hypothetical protein